MSKDYKDVKGKLPYHLVDSKTLAVLPTVLQYGIEKYGEENKCSYQNGDFDTYYSALMRHLETYRCGEEFDKESGLPHLYHVLFNAYVLSYLYLRDEE